MFPAGIRRLRPLLPGTFLARQQQLSENSRAATDGVLVGLSSLAGVLSAGTFRMEYAPKHVPALIALACSSRTWIITTLVLGTWMKGENSRRNRGQGVELKAGDIDTDVPTEGQNSLLWKYFT